MAKIFQRSFAGGELAPALYARTDLVKYATGARRIRNAFVGRQGGAYNRAGTIFDTEVKDSTSKVRLIPFDLPNSLSYQLEFGANYVRPLLNWKPIFVSVASISAISKASSAVVTTVDYHGFQTGDVVTFAGVSGMTQINGMTGTVTSIGVTEPYNTFVVNINSSAFSTYTSGGTSTITTPREISFTTTFTQFEIFEMTYQQSNTEMILAHVNHVPQTFKYYGPNRWVFSDTATSPSIAAPGSFANLGSAGTAVWWGVTAIKAETFEESLVSTTSSNTIPATGTPVGLTWSLVPGAVQYNIYRGFTQSTLGLISVVYDPQTGYTDKGEVTPDYENGPPIVRTMFSSAAPGVRPQAVGFYQQRQFYGNLGPAPVGIIATPNQTPYADKILASRIGSPTTFNIDRPVVDDSSLSFRLLNKVPQEIRHFLDVGKLLVFTAQGEWVLNGDLDGAITPSKINPKLISGYGSGIVPPIQIDSFSIYVQKGTSPPIRTLGFEFQIEGYRGTDLTVNSSHLFAGKSVVSWDFQKSPDPVVWAALSDGTMAALTLLPDQAVVAWHRHDTTNGLIECVMRSQDQIGFVINRTINGVTKRYIEHFAAREYSDIKDAPFLDACKTFDGRIAPIIGLTYTISGGTTWDSDDLLTVTSSQPIFNLVDWATGQWTAMFFDGGTIGQIRMELDSITSSTVAKFRPNKTIPVAMRNTGLVPKYYGSRNILGLSHLEGQKVSVLGDGFVVASPNNSNYPVMTVTGGVLNIGAISYSVVKVGLPITSDIETLNIDNPGGESLVDKAKAITSVMLWVEKTRGILVGAVPPDPDQNPTTVLQSVSFSELKYRSSEGYDEPSREMTKAIGVKIAGMYNQHGRILIRQIDPLPMGILAVAPDGYIATGRA